VQAQGGVERGEAEAVDAQRARQRVASDGLYEVGAPGDDAGLRSAEQLVAGEEDDVGAVVDRPAGSRFAGQVRVGQEQPRADVIDGDDAAFAAEARELGGRDLLGEADDAEVRGVGAQDQRRRRGDRGGIVAEAGAVRRADLDEARTGLLHDRRQAEAVADLDHLPARDDYLATMGERCEREHERTGRVVDGHAGLGTGQARNQWTDVSLAGAALAGRQVELEIGIAARTGRDRRHGLGGQRRAAEVGVDDDAGGVDDGAQRLRIERPGGGGDDRRLGGAIGRWLCAIEQRCAPRVKRLSHELGGTGLAELSNERRERGIAQYVLDRRQLSQRLHVANGTGNRAATVPRRSASRGEAL